MKKPSDNTWIAVSNGFGHKERTPYVQVLIEQADFMVQLPPALARDLAHRLLAASDTADTDALVYRYLKESVDDPTGLIQMIKDFRAWRAENAP